jgi:hypothetical protein
MAVWSNVPTGFSSTGASTGASAQLKDSFLGAIEVAIRAKKTRIQSECNPAIISLLMSFIQRIGVLIGMIR